MPVLHKFMVTITREGSSLAEIQWIDAENEGEAIASARSMASMGENDSAQIRAAIHEDLTTA